MRLPKVSVLILNWNGGPDTIACLDSLKTLAYPSFRVIVLDNASSDNSWELFAKYSTPPYPLTLVQTGANLGFSGGNNVGIKKALVEGADYVWLLNNDTKVEPNTLDKLVAAAESDPTTGIAGPLALTMEEPPRIWFAGGKFNWLKTRGFHPWYGEAARNHLKNYPPSSRAPEGGVAISGLGRFQRLLRRFAPRNDVFEAGSTEHVRSAPQDITDVDYITGGVMLIKRAVLDDVDLLAEDYFLYYEDADFNARAAKQGWRRVLVPAAIVYHKGSASAKAGSPNYQYYHLRNGLMFSWRHGPSRVLTLTASVWLAAKELVKIIIGYHRERSLGGLHGVIDFWRRKTGKR